MFEMPLQYHLCTQEDLEEFAAPTRDAENVIQDAMSDETKGLYCLDWDNQGDEIAIWGAETGYEYQRIEIIYAPCNFVPPGFEKEYPIPEGCIENEAEQRKYLDSFYMTMYVSDNRFVQDGYDNSAITSNSKFLLK